jgi:hypothetical protein
MQNYPVNAICVESTVRRNGEKETENIPMSEGNEREHGVRWWLRYVIVPLVGGGGIVAIAVAIISNLTIKSPTSTSVGPSASANAKPEQIISIIQEQQRKNVKESWGELAQQGFTDDDLNRFVQTRTTERITDSLKRDPRFLDVVLAIRKMEPSKRSALLISAEKPLRPTWAELGRISSEGQTEAGQKVERMIATAIINFVKELVKIPDDKFVDFFNN